MGKTGHTWGKPAPDPRVAGPLALGTQRLFGGSGNGFAFFMHGYPFAGTCHLELGLATVTYEHRWVPVFMWYIKYVWEHPAA